METIQLNDVNGDVFNDLTALTGIHPFDVSNYLFELAKNVSLSFSSPEYSSRMKKLQKYNLRNEDLKLVSEALEYMHQGDNGEEDIVLIQMYIVKKTDKGKVHVRFARKHKQLFSKVTKKPIHNVYPSVEVAKQRAVAQANLVLRAHFPKAKKFFAQIQIVDLAELKKNKK